MPRMRTSFQFQNHLNMNSLEGGEGGYGGSKHGPQIPVTQGKVPQISTMSNHWSGKPPLWDGLDSGYIRRCGTGSPTYNIASVAPYPRSAVLSYSSAGPSDVSPRFLCVATLYHLVQRSFVCCTMLWHRGLLTALLLSAFPHVIALDVDGTQNDESCQIVALDYADSGSYLVDGNSEGNFRYASLFQGTYLLGSYFRLTLTPG